jgi:hypothetical protein
MPFMLNIQIEEIPTALLSDGQSMIGAGQALKNWIVETWVASDVWQVLRSI